MAEETTEESADEALESVSKKKKLIIAAAAALVVIAAAVGVYFYMAVGFDTSLDENAEIERGLPTYVDFKPAFTVNLDAQDSVSFLQISLQVLTFDDDVAEELIQHKPMIRNNLMVLFAKQKSLNLRSAPGKEKLQQDALNVVQAVIEKYGSGGEVDNVFFTSFVMQ